MAVIMKKLDKLILSSFIGPFILTFVVVVFILLTQTMLKYFDDFVGKDLGVQVFAELIFYFSLFTTPVALPLAILLSSLMTFGNLGEHFELSAIKSSGISLLRTLRAMFVVTIFLVVMAFLNNNYIVPKANLKAYSLLYDIKKKKPALDIKEGAFYSGLQGLSIKVNEKFDNGELRDVIIYDHREGVGNSNIVIADSGRMYTMFNEQYLVLELFDGNMYSVSEMPSQRRRRVNFNEIEPYRRDNFETSKLVLSLAEFNFSRTKEDLFKSSRLMKNLKQLKHDIDSLAKDLYDVEYFYYKTIERNSLQWMRDKVEIPVFLENQKQINDSLRKLEQEKYYEEEEREEQKRMQSDSVKKKYEKLDSTTIQRKDTIARPRIDSMNRRRRRPKDIKPSKENIKRKLKKEDLQKHKISIVKQKVLFASVQPRKQDSDTVLVNADSTEFNEREIALDSIILPQDSVLQDSTIVEVTAEDSIALAQARIDSIYAKVDSAYAETENKSTILAQAVSQARFLKSTLSAESTKIRSRFENLNKHKIEQNKKYAQAFACLVFFLIGAPLGAIIKRGGLGIPVIISIAFFIFYYIITMTGEKWARQGVVDPIWGVWGANFILLPIGLFFLKQARNDARLFDADFYNVAFNKIKMFIRRFMSSGK